MRLHAGPLAYSAIERAPHSLYACTTPEEARECLEAATGMTVAQIAAQIVSPTTAKAVFLVGSIPLGMATPDSDIDLIVLEDNRLALLQQESRPKNTIQRLAFMNESDPLRAGEFLLSLNGVLVDMAVIMTPAIGTIYQRLRHPGPELSEREIMTLSRLNTGWRLWQTNDYLEQREVTLKDPVLDIYCSTRNFVNALQFWRKASKALEHADLPLALHLGHCSVESTYLAYLASDGISYLGAKWVAQVSHARGAEQRLARHPILKQGLPMLYPAYTEEAGEVRQYLQSVADLIRSIRSVIESRTPFRIAFKTCPQIHPI